MFRTILFLLAVLCINVVVVVAQDDDVIRTNTDLVVLNVTVTDKDGHYAKGLKASDFKVFEDGVEVKPNMIASFSLQESPYAAHARQRSGFSMDCATKMSRRSIDSIQKSNACRSSPVDAISRRLLTRFMRRG